MFGNINLSLIHANKRPKILSKSIAEKPVHLSKWGDIK